jgi:hypothetical protein
MAKQSRPLLRYDCVYYSYCLVPKKLTLALIVQLAQIVTVLNSQLRALSKLADDASSVESRLCHNMPKPHLKEANLDSQARLATERADGPGWSDAGSPKAELAPSGQVKKPSCPPPANIRDGHRPPPAGRSDEKHGPG